jgi:hypothetical protein
VTGTIEPLTTTLIAPARFRDLLLKLGPSDWVERSGRSSSRGSATLESPAVKS